MMPTTLHPQRAFEWAVDNIAKWGDTDVFPLVSENHVFHDKRVECVALLMAMHNNLQESLTRNPPVNQSALAPAGYFGFRWATQIDPIWNAYLLGLVLSLHEFVEDYRVPMDREAVFSYRIDPGAHNPDIFATGEWSAFQDAARESSASAGFVVQTDIADFYSRVYHHRLENALTRLGHRGDEHSRIMDLLSRFSGSASYGLPVGGPASRILSEVLLTAVDNLLILEGIRHMRFADDYLIFVDSREAAYRTLAFLSLKLQTNEGLSLQKAKTRVFPADEFRASLDAEIDEAQAGDRPFVRLSLRFDPYSLSAHEDYSALKAEVDKYDIAGMLGRELAKSRVRPGLFRRLLRAVRFLDSNGRDAAAVSLMNNIDRLAPLVPSILRVARDLYRDLGGEAQQTIDNSLIAAIQTGSHLMTLDLNLAYAVRLLALSNDPRLPALFAGMYGRAEPFVKAPLMVAMARWKQTAFVSDLKNGFSNMHPWERRTFILASYSLGDEGKHWRQNNSRHFSPFDSLVRGWASEQVQRPTWEIPI